MKAVGALRMYYLSRALLEKGHAVSVISTRNALRLQQEPMEIPESIDVQRVQTLDYRTFNLRKARKVHYNESVKDGRVGRFGVRMINSFPFNVFFGEGGLIYVIQAYRHACRKINTLGVTHIVSSFRPYADHIVGYLLKGRYPQLHWTADFRDVHVDSIKQNVFWPRIQHWFNRRCLRRANLVTTVSEGCKTELIRYHANVEVIQNGVRELKSQGIRLLDKFTLSYTGSLYGQLRTPAPVFEALNALIASGKVNRSDLQICYAGKDSSEWESWIRTYHLEDVYKDYGLLSGHAARELQATSHINLLLTFADKELKGALTAKFFEYLAAERPILTIINGVMDPEIRSLMIAHNAGKIYATDELSRESLQQTLYSYYTAWKNQNGSIFSVKSPLLDDILWTNRVETFMQRIRESQRGMLLQEITSP